VKILVFVDHFTIGGVPINAIDLATELIRTHGHEVVLFGTPGPAVDLAQKRGIRFIAAPQAGGQPSLRRMAALRRAVRTEGIDMVQAWDWRACMDAFFGVHLPLRIPLVVCHATMELEHMLPRRVPTMYMTPELVDLARTDGRAPVAFLPVPTDLPAASQWADGRAFRSACGARSDDILIVTVSRLDNWIKSESIERTIAVTRELGRETSNIKFVIVGGGEAQAQLERLAQDANAALGRQAVVVFGEMADPRSAYAAADIVVGMGGSALRGMASSKPVIIVGKNGFAAKLDEHSQAGFLYRGMYGAGDGSNAGLFHALRELGASAQSRAHHAAIAKTFVGQHFSLPVAAASLDRFISLAKEDVPPMSARLQDGARALLVHAYTHGLPPAVRAAIRHVRHRALLRPHGLRNKGSTA
jgi:L-malate glycosyltransferase